MRRLLLRWAIPVLVLLGSIGAIGAWIASAPRPAFSEQDAAALEHGGNVERGRIVFAAGDCASCHASPGQPDQFRLGGGLALASPFGTFRVPNISPDPVDGIGRWRTVDLANALISGVSPQGKHYYPALPYPSFAHMRVEDVRDLMAFLRTLPPVSGRAPPHEIPFPLSIRRFVGIWKLLFMHHGPIAMETSRSTAWNRGHYLVEALGHCAECHSTRNVLGGIKRATRFAGGRDPEGTGFSPNITPAHLGEWSEKDIVELLTSGRTPAFRRAGSSMADVVANTAMLPASDREAIAVYLKSLPPRPTPSP
jgi:mono/diheme cytochrome c family protein